MRTRPRSQGFFDLQPRMCRYKVRSKRSDSNPGHATGAIEDSDSYPGPTVCYPMLGLDLDRRHTQGGGDMMVAYCESIR